MGSHPGTPEARSVLRRVLFVALLLVAGVVVTLLIALPAGTRALREAQRGRDLLLSAERRLRAQDADGARSILERARTEFTRAEGDLSSGLVLPASYVPLVRRQVKTARALVGAGRLIADAGLAAADAADARPPGGWRAAGGAIELDALGRAVVPVERSREALARARRTLESAPSSLIVPPVAAQLDEALRRVREAERGVARAAAGFEAAPALLGAEGKRRYFMAFDNLAELRGTGGLIGYFAVLEVEDGRLALGEPAGRPQEDFPPPEESGPKTPEWFLNSYRRYGVLHDWRNINITTDFPTVARIILQVTPEDVGPLDGVIQMDPIALSSLLRLTGPVTAPDLPEPLTSDNVSEITQHEAYVRFARRPDRVEFLGDVVGVVFEKLLASNVRVNERLLELLGGMVSGGHIQMYSAVPSEQEALEAVGLARHASRTEDATDVLGFVSNNSSGNKIDWFLRRRVRYGVDLDPGTNEASFRLEADLTNGAPGAGLPAYIIGSPDPNLADGENRTITMLLRSRDDALEEMTVSGEPVQPSRDREDRLLAYQTIHVIPPGGRVTVAATGVVHGAVRGTDRERVYRLHVLRQPVAHPDRFELTLEAPESWRIEGTRTFSGPLTSDLVVEVRLVHRFEAWLVERAVLGPFRLVRDIVSAVF